MTLSGEHREIMKVVWRIPGMLQHMPTGTWLWEKVLWNSCQQANWRMEQNCRSHDAQLY